MFTRKGVAACRETSSRKRCDRCAPCRDPDARCALAPGLCCAKPGWGKRSLVWICAL